MFLHSPPKHIQLIFNYCWHGLDFRCHNRSASLLYGRAFEICRYIVFILRQLLLLLQLIQQSTIENDGVMIRGHSRESQFIICRVRSRHPACSPYFQPPFTLDHVLSILYCSLHSNWRGRKMKRKSKSEKNKTFYDCITSHNFPS